MESARTTVPYEPSGSSSESNGGPKKAAAMKKQARPLKAADVEILRKSVE
ncbi:hypothetical protein [Prescottella agglutinans]